jgi:tetratricopeptide (TPR) repeat protein
MADFPESPEDKLVQEAEELMRQRRFIDAASRYQDIRRQSPTDLWANLGYISALECAGNVAEAEQALEETTSGHRRSAPLHRFRHLFFVRREDIHRAQLSQAALQLEVVEEGPEDQLADLYFNQGRYHEARSELERLLRDGLLDVGEQQDMKASVIARIGACLRQNGDFEPARERLLEALALEPGNHWTLSELAEVERALGNTAQARRRYRESLEVSPNDQWTRGHLAQLECEDGNAGAAVTLYEEILAAEPKAAWAKVELAQVVSDSDAERAASLCESALDNDPSYPWAHAQLGNLARRAGRLEEARKHYQAAAAASPNATWILHEQADLCRHMGRMEEAYAHLERAKGLNPYDAVTYGYFADLLRHEGKFREAIAHLEKAVEFDGEYTWAWRELAELRGLTGKHEEAEAAYRQAVRIEPDEAINDGLKAFLLRWQGRRDAALPYLERAVEHQHDYLWAWREQIDYAFSIQRPDLAEQAARRALVAMPDAPPLMGMLSEALRRQGKRLEASAVASKAIALASDVPQLWAIQAEIAAEEDDLESALRCARQAAELDRGLEYQALLAQVLIAAGRDDEAAAVVRPLLTQNHPIQPAFELAATLSERRGDVEEAKRYCDQALRAGFAHDPRLLVRRARLGLLPAAGAQANAAVVAPLATLFERTSGVPWRELAQVYANAGQGIMARRAAYLHINQAAQAGTPPGDQAKSWLALAELELALGNTADCTQALEHCLARDPDLVPALILAAVLSDQRGDLAGAILHLEHIDRLQASGGDAAPATHDAMLHRQLASLYERSGRPADADALWQRLCASHARPLVQCEYACFLLRQERVPEAERSAELVLPELLPALAQAPETQQLLRDLAIRRLARADGGVSGPRRACDGLLAYDQYLVTSNRILLAQLSLACDDTTLMRRQLDLAQAEEPDNRAIRLLRVRLHAATREHDQAEALARALVEQATGDQEAAVLLAECLVQRGHCDRALAALDAPQLPAKPGLERGLLAALLALDLNGEGACLTRLGRLPVPDLASPLVRVVATAWPGAWCRADAFAAATPADLRALPALANLARRLARALSASARDDLASCLLVSVAELLQVRGEGTDACRLFALAAAALRRGGSRAWAWRMAWRSRRLGALLACLLP